MTFKPPVLEHARRKANTWRCSQYSEDARCDHADSMHCGSRGRQHEPERSSRHYLTTRQHQERATTSNPGH
ncbi:hypothetical protein DOTSEDRAFT_72195 [Dothistroma septosporum NZE10]|uniref:Uncharacterized protein n=1 Tax=Dothistroma septosporum (strain NZE10 / CBS 128990) TaxID=675120 RepID=N1PMK3_DOTSN|nr:hypothetical protein DOTSEDRAFT_72195 [Dothistroma septosporum NZE10]